MYYRLLRKIMQVQPEKKKQCLNKRVCTKQNGLQGAYKSVGYSCVCTYTSTPATSMKYSILFSSPIFPYYCPCILVNTGNKHCPSCANRRLRYRIVFLVLAGDIDIGYIIQY